MQHIAIKRAEVCKPLGLPPDREHDIADEQVSENFVTWIRAALDDEKGHTYSSYRVEYMSGIL